MCILSGKNVNDDDLYYLLGLSALAILLSAFIGHFDLPTWEQFIMHADEQGKFDQLSKKQNKLLSDNSKEQASAFFAHAAKQEENFFGKNRRRRLLDSKTKSAKIQC